MKRWLDRLWTERMRILGVASALPQNLYPQEHITAALIERWAAELKAPERLRRIHAPAGVDVRHLAFSLEDYALTLKPKSGVHRSNLGIRRTILHRMLVERGGSRRCNAAGDPHPFDECHRLVPCSIP
jgi:predicted naringenin-chalcone synthase